MDKLIRVHGIKLSPELVQLDLRPDPIASESLASLFALLGQHKINVPLATSAGTNAGTRASCCIEAEESTRITAERVTVFSCSRKQTCR